MLLEHTAPKAQPRLLWQQRAITRGVCTGVESYSACKVMLQDQWYDCLLQTESSSAGNHWGEKGRGYQSKLGNVCQLPKWCVWKILQAVLREEKNRWKYGSVDVISYGWGTPSLWRLVKVQGKWFQVEEVEGRTVPMIRWIHSLSHDSWDEGWEVMELQHSRGRHKYAVIANKYLRKRF